MSVHPPIPIEAGERLCLDYGYDQVVIIARAVAKDTESVTTFGLGDDNSRAAMLMGNHLETEVMGWPPESTNITTTQWALRKVLAPERYK